VAGEGIGWTCFILIGRAALIFSCAIFLIAAKKPPQIPAEYQGSWSMDPAYCNYEGDTLDNELYVTPNTVGFHAEHHRVKSIKLKNGALQMRYFAMKDAYRVAPKNLKLSNDGTKLNDTWHKCPDNVQVQEAK
jgi:hypothetical protein